jgi:hypothetical protein
MRHKRIHAKITKHLEETGDATTGEIHRWLINAEPTKKNYAKGGGYSTGQSIHVVGKVLTRKPIIKVGFDQQAKQAIWGIRDSE